MERIFNIIKAEDFNFALTNAIIDMYSSDYERVFEQFSFDEKAIESLTDEELMRLTKISAIIEYIGSRQPKAKLYDWIYNNKLILKEPYTPGVEQESLARIRRILAAPREFSLRNVFFDEKTLRPI